MFRRENQIVMYKPIYSSGLSALKQYKGLTIFNFPIFYFICSDVSNELIYINIFML